MAFTKAILTFTPHSMRHVLDGTFNLQDLINRFEQIRLVNRVTFTFGDESNCVFDASTRARLVENS